MRIILLMQFSHIVTLCNYRFFLCKSELSLLARFAWYIISQLTWYFIVTLFNVGYTYQLLINSFD